MQSVPLHCLSSCAVNLKSIVQYDALHHLSSVIYSGVQGFIQRQSRLCVPLNIVYSKCLHGNDAYTI